MDKVYLVCGLNDENYTEAWYEVHKTHEEAVVAAIKLCKENVEDEEGFDIFKDLNRISCGGGDEFYVTQIFEIDLSKGNLLLVWYHAYDGVDFIIDGQTRDIKQLEDMYTKERNVMLNTCDSKKAGIDFEKEYDQFVLDTGTEWEVLDVVDLYENGLEELM